MCASRLSKSLPKLYHVSNELLDTKVLPKFPTHELLVRLGFVNHPKPGLVHWLPMGNAILQKLQGIVHREMQNAGVEQVKLSNLSSAALWQQTGRWSGTELFRVTDFTGAEFCLAPTCEEEITTLVKSQVVSYKNFPVLYYQINSKYRDEKRPRSGLLRGKEFIMKDAYSFDISPDAAMASYGRMVGAYRKIFEQLGVPFVQADADTGDIGGPLSHEWHYVHSSGEDTLFSCTSCGNNSNIEKTKSYPASEETHSSVAVSYHTTEDKNTLVCAYYPSSRKYRANFLKQEIPDLDLTCELSQEQMLDIFRDEETLISKRIVRVMDSRLTSQANFPDFPINFINRSLITTLTDIPIVEAEEGEICYDCEDGTLQKERAIEVGHTFFLGDRYTRAFDFAVDVPQEHGKLKKVHVMMGCYGIGISRIIAAIAELNRDEHGLRWPACIAPWQATVVNNTGDSQIESAILENLGSSGVDCRVDDREKIRIGKKIKDSHMFGIPLVVIAGKNYPKVEIEVRGIQKADAWKKERDLANDLQWEVEYGSDGQVSKHIVDISHVGIVARKLVADM